MMLTVLGVVTLMCVVHGVATMQVLGPRTKFNHTLRRAVQNYWQNNTRDLRNSVRSLCKHMNTTQPFETSCSKLFKKCITFTGCFRNVPRRLRSYQRYLEKVLKKIRENNLKLMINKTITSIKRAIEMESDELMELNFTRNKTNYIRCNIEDNDFCRNSDECKERLSEMSCQLMKFLQSLSSFQNGKVMSQVNESRTRKTRPV